MLTLKGHKRMNKSSKWENTFKNYFLKHRFNSPLGTIIINKQYAYQIIYFIKQGDDIFSGIDK